MLCIPYQVLDANHCHLAAVYLLPAVTLQEPVHLRFRYGDLPPSDGDDEAEHTGVGGYGNDGNDARGDAETAAREEDEEDDGQFMHVTTGLADLPSMLCVFFFDI